MTLIIVAVALLVLAVCLHKFLKNKTTLETNPLNIEQVAQKEDPAAAEPEEDKLLVEKVLSAAVEESKPVAIVEEPAKPTQKKRGSKPKTVKTTTAKKAIKK